MKILQERAMTFMELMIAVTIVGIMAAAAVLPNLKTIEAAKRRSARNVLQAITAGEKVYQTFNTTNSHVFCTPEPVWPRDPLAVPPSPFAPTCSWAEIYSDDPNVPSVIPGVVFTVAVNAAGDGFIAQARRVRGGCNGDIITLNETGAEGGIPFWPPNGC